MVRHLLLLSAFLPVFSCHALGQHLKDAQEVRQVFDEEEIRQLEQILDFFHATICEVTQVDPRDILSCYEAFFEWMHHKVIDLGDGSLPIDNHRYKELLNQLDLPGLHIFWWDTDMAMPTQEGPSLAARIDGKFVSFLTEYSKVNAVASRYTSQFRSAGEFTPSMFADVVINYKDFDVRDDRMKLLVTMHYLMIHQVFGSVYERGAGR
jgi:hypothetical protein